MDDTTTLSKIHVGMNVIIKLLSNPAETSEGVITRIVSEDDEPKGIIVILENGKKGNIWKINNSDEIIKKRICNENQFTENKETFGELPMKQKVIPQTIQSFLNSGGKSCAPIKVGIISIIEVLFNSLITSKLFISSSRFKP